MTVLLLLPLLINLYLDFNQQDQMLLFLEYYETTSGVITQFYKFVFVHFS